MTLASNNASLTVPASVTVASGATTAIIQRDGGGYHREQSERDRHGDFRQQFADRERQSAGAGAGLEPGCAVPPALVRKPASTCTVTLTRVAPAGGSSVTLTSNNASLSVPASLTIPAGATTSSFTATAVLVKTTAIATIVASLNGSGATVSVTLTGSVR